LTQFWLLDGHHIMQFPMRAMRVTADAEASAGSRLRLIEWA
jgi:hypothetical protein